MCIVAYVGSDVPLPLCAWTVDARALNVSELDEHEQGVRQPIKRRHVYYVGSSLGCGCQFAAGVYGEEYCEPDDLEEGRRDRRNLVLFLWAALKRQTSVELLTCWDGDESHVPARRVTVSPDFFSKPEAFPQMDELFIYVVQSAN